MSAQLDTQSQLLTNLSEVADLCRNEGAGDVADLLDCAGAEIERLQADLDTARAACLLNADRLTQERQEHAARIAALTQLPPPEYPYESFHWSHRHRRG